MSAIYESYNRRTQTAIRSLVIDDHPVVRIGLRALHRLDSTIEVVGEAATAAEALTLTKELLPDILVLDMVLPDENGAEVCGKIKAFYPTIRVLVLSSYDDNNHVVSAMHAGADGYLLKGSSMSQVIEAIHEIMQGNAYYNPIVTRHLINHVNADMPTRCFHQLTSQELNVLAQVATGKTNKEIAITTNMELKAVGSALNRCFKKLHVNTRTSAALSYIQHHGGLFTARTTDTVS